MRSLDGTEVMLAEYSVDTKTEPFLFDFFAARPGQETPSFLFFFYWELGFPLVFGCPLPVCPPNGLLVFPSGQDFRRLELASGDKGQKVSGTVLSAWTAIVQQCAEDAESGGDLLQAAKRGDAEHMLELLKNHDPTADGYTQVTPLQNASAKGHLEVVQYLVDAGVDKEKATDSGVACISPRAGPPGSCAAPAESRC